MFRHPVDPMPPQVEEATVHAMRMAGEPVLVMVTPVRVAQVHEASGELVTDDAFAAAVRAHGAQPMTDLGFHGDPVPGWSVQLAPGTGDLRITGPGVIAVLYEGSLTPHAEWLHLIAENQRHDRGLVLITGTAAGSDPDAALAMIAAGRASWLRCPVELTGPGNR